MKKEDFDKINIIPIIENKGSCSICLESMTKNIIKLECNHYYHKDCAEEWLCKCSNKCPICKTEISEGGLLLTFPNNSGSASLRK